MTRIKNALKENGRSQSYVSNKMDVSPNTISNWCRGITEPTLSQAIKLAEVIGCELTDLIYQENRGDKDEK